jgi:hypothetical protein
MCPDCKVDLEENVVNDVVTTDDFTEIYMVSNRMEAEVVQGILEEQGVEFLIRDLRVFPVLPDFGLRARLRIAVPTDKEEEARKVLLEAQEDGALTERGTFL